MAELKEALKKTKNNKSPGPDEIPIEVIRAAGQEMLRFLLRLLNVAYLTLERQETPSKKILSPVMNTSIHLWFLLPWKQDKLQQCHGNRSAQQN